MSRVQFAPTAANPPIAPSKYNVIPIHNSDRQAFKSCRRQWAWSSPSRMNLVPRSAVYGVQKAFWYGTGIHYSLERYYNPVIREDPWIAWETWFDLQWYGGIVAEDEVKQFVDRNPIVWNDIATDLTGNVSKYKTYKVDGLCDILPDFGDDNESIFLEFKDLGTGMMKFYKDYAEANDDFTVIMVEHDFSVPVLNEKGEALYAVDTRTMPEGWEPDFTLENEFGPLMKEVPYIFGAMQQGTSLVKQVHTRGRMDQIQQEHQYGRYGIMDHKTAGTIGEDYFRHLELDEQSTSYLTFGQLEAQLHDLPYKQLEYITYQALLKGYPKPPNILKNGLPSLAKDQPTTAKLFEAFILENGLKPIFDVDEKMQRYYAYLIGMGDKLYIQRDQTWRNASQRMNAMTRLYYEAQDMLNSPVLYPNPRKEYSCLNCAFRTPCIQAESGDDFMGTLENGYIGNWDR